MPVPSRFSAAFDSDDFDADFDASDTLRHRFLVDEDEATMQDAEAGFITIRVGSTAYEIPFYAVA